MQQESKSNARYISTMALKKIYEREGYSDLVLNELFKSSNLNEKDKAFATRCVYGVLQWQRLIDYYIDKLSKKPLDKLSLNILILLRLGLYQIMFLDRVPDRAAVYETVKVAYILKEKKASGFLNGILRNYLRKRQEIKEPFDISIRHSHPDWMVELWINRFGKEKTLQLCEANNTIPESFLRTNTLRTDRDKLVEKLNEKNLECEKADYPPEAIKINSLQGIEEDELFKKGYFYIQDINSMSVSHLASPLPGQRVADLCSSPGGKTTHMAEMMQNQGKITAVDLYPHRVKLVKENCARLGITNVEIIQGDAREIMEKNYGEKFDVTLVDAPCSALGVLRKQPELKWRIKEKDINSLKKLQRELLQTAVNVTKSGGRIVYSTCTLTPEENEDLCREILAEDSRLKSDDPTKILKEEIFKNAFEYNDEKVLFLPSKEGGDGFFMTAFKK